MTDTEKKLIEDVLPRIENWRRCYRDKTIRNISIMYAVQKALELTKNKTDFSMDYLGPKEYQEDSQGELNHADADLLNIAWINLSSPDTSVLSVGTNGLNAQMAKTVILLFTFYPPYVLKRVATKLWRIRKNKVNAVIDDALIYFALKVRFFEGLRNG